jgi:hypothetical protein
MIAATQLRNFPNNLDRAGSDEVSLNDSTVHAIGQVQQDYQTNGS